MNKSYLAEVSTTLKPFMFSKSKLKLTVSIKDKFHVNKQTRSLMPNLIHSLDATSICLL